MHDILNSEEFYFLRCKELQGSKRVGWSSSYKQNIRYATLVKDLDLRGKKCLLLGCGEGAGVPHLQSKGCNDIIGTDLCDWNIEVAKNNYPEYQFHKVEGTKQTFQDFGPFDYVFCSGTFNVKTKVNQYEKIVELLELADYINEGLGISLTTKMPPNFEICTFDPIKTIELFITRFNHWKADYTYLKDDFCIWGFNSHF